MTTTASVVLAAGEGARFRRSGGDGHKLLAPFRGRPLVEWALEHAVAAELDETAVVQGGRDLRDRVPDCVTIIENPRWREGKATSLAASVTWAASRGHDAIVVGLADEPTIRPSAWRTVAYATSPIAVATYSGARGHPVRLSAEVWPLLPKAGDAGAVVVMRERPDLVAEIACHGESVDIDTVEDLERWS